MCLPFYSAPILPPTDRCRVLVSRLRTLFYIQLVLAILKCFFMFTSVSSGDSYLDLFSCCAIYMAYSQISHMGCVIHIFLSLYSFISEFVVIGTFIQDGISLFGTNSTYNFYMVLILISVIFYVVAIVIVFQAYKEFKAVSMEGLLQHAEQGGGYFGQEDDQDYYGQQYPYYQNEPQQQPPAQPRPQAQPRAQAQQPVYQAQPQPQQNANQNVQMSNSSNTDNQGNRNTSGFKAFVGSGVKIGGS